MNMRIRFGVAVLAATSLLVGCVGQGLRETELAPASFAPAVAASVADVMAADIMDPTYLDLPSGDRWPRTMRGGGPLVATVTFAPYVGMLGTLADIDRADDGSGFGVAFSWRLAVSASSSLDVGAGFETSSHTSPATGLDATATRTCLRATLSLNKGSKLQPFVAGGAGAYALDFDGLASEFAFSGAGGFVGGGVEYVPTGGVAVRFDVALHAWDAADGSGGGGVTETLVVALGASLGF